MWPIVYLSARIIVLKFYLLFYKWFVLIHSLARLSVLICSHINMFGCRFEQQRYITAPINAYISRLQNHYSAYECRSAPEIFGLGWILSTLCITGPFSSFAPTIVYFTCSMFLFFWVGKFLNELLFHTANCNYTWKIEIGCRLSISTATWIETALKRQLFIFKAPKTGNSDNLCWLVST